MINIQTLTFNPFEVNCYVLWDETGDCAIVDASCAEKFEDNELLSFIKGQKLNPVISVYTHCHTDHVAGADFIHRQFGLKPVIHKAGLPILTNAANAARVYGMKYPEPPKPGKYVEEGDRITFGNSTLEVIYTPGHVDGSICLYNAYENLLITGDVLFYGSIGRTDFPTGDYNTLIENIQTKIMVLPDAVRVYPGHGPETTIGNERRFNPFL